MKLFTIAALVLACLLSTSASAAVLFYQQSCCILERLPLTLDTPTQPFAFGLLEFVNFDGVYANLRVVEGFIYDGPGGIGVFSGDKPIYDRDRLVNRLSWHTLSSWPTGMEIQLRAVPEPATWMMMLGALVLVGASRYSRELS